MRSVPTTWLSMSAKISTWMTVIETTSTSRLGTCFYVAPSLAKGSAAQQMQQCRRLVRPKDSYRCTATSATPRYSISVVRTGNCQLPQSLPYFILISFFPLALPRPSDTFIPLMRLKKAHAPPLATTPLMRRIDLHAGRRVVIDCCLVHNSLEF